MNAYLAEVTGAKVKTLDDVITFNKEDPAANLPFTGRSCSSARKRRVR